MSLWDLSRRTVQDVRNGRHREAYALFLVGVALVVLGLVGVASAQILLSSILLALSFLVFHTAAETSDQRPALEQVLRNREDYGPLSRMLPGVRDLRVYGPTAVNILVHSADLKRFVLSRGGVVRVIVQDDSPQLVATTAMQLDDNLDLERTLQSSLGVLEKLAVEPGFSYRKLPVNPGFSLIIINADDRDGYLIFESQGFQDENISDRMHIVIRKQESARWFSYWVARFASMWEAAASVSPSEIEQADDQTSQAQIS
jgi:hypothetical protein